MTDPGRIFLQERGGPIDATALFEALRLASDGVSRVAERQSEDAKVLREMSETLHQIDKRLALVESVGFVAKLEEHERRLIKLEGQENRREGALSLGSWILRNWPALFGYIALVVVLFDKGALKVGV